MITKTRLWETFHELTGTEFKIYTNLELYAGKKKYCYPDMRKMAETLNIYPTTIDDNIKNLEKKGFIKVGRKQGTRGRRNEYWLLK